MPSSVLNKINAECSSDAEKMSAVVNYAVATIPDITWEDIAAALYKEDEEKAMERVKPYLHIIPGGSCFNIVYTGTAICSQYCPALPPSYSVHGYKQPGSLYHHCKRCGTVHH